MKLYSSVREILSAVLLAPLLPSVMAIMHPVNAGIDAPRVSDHSFDIPVSH